MNKAIPGLSSDISRAAPKTMDSVVNWRLLLLCLLFIAVIFVSIKTIVHRHQARTLFVEAQNLEKERDVLAARWSRLKLEQGTVLNQVSVERQARRDLGMRIPKATDIHMIREPVTTLMAKNSPGRNRGLSAQKPDTAASGTDRLSKGSAGMVGHRSSQTGKVSELRKVSLSD